MIHHLRAAGVSLVLDSRGAGVPAVVHWGRDLGALESADLETLCDASTPAVGPSSIDAPLRISLLPVLGDGWSGRPAMSMDAAAAAVLDRDDSIDVWKLPKGILVEPLGDVAADRG